MNRSVCFTKGNNLLTEDILKLNYVGVTFVSKTQIFLNINSKRNILQLITLNYFYYSLNPVHLPRSNRITIFNTNF